MSIVSTIYPDPLESARCRRSPLPRRSLEPWDVVDDRCEPSVFELTRREPLRKAPAKADSLRSGFGFEPVKKPNIFPGAKNGFWMLSLIAPPMRLCHTDEPTLSSMPCVQADTSRGVEPRRLSGGVLFSSRVTVSRSTPSLSAPIRLANAVKPDASAKSTAPLLSVVGRTHLLMSLRALSGTKLPTTFEAIFSCAGCQNCLRPARVFADAKNRLGRVWYL